ncbi:uncharacterized protein LOC129597836 [Paramacrobiotus metropolitanus]|uniref:uncharacterized protein LOC129597836 n=1 Tax=Paramacrobiotus metropolitanus TaxID=2943436 RepID=UPI0024461833|nr:uncharacterized protein LOC129597836 [Paramacrobiotus metropolitanus]
MKAGCLRTDGTDGSILRRQTLIFFSATGIMKVHLYVLILASLSSVRGSDGETYKNGVLYSYKEALVYFADAILQPLIIAPVPTGQYYTELTDELKTFIRNTEAFHAKIFNLSTAAEAEKTKMKDELQRKTMEFTTISTELDQKQHKLQRHTAALEGKHVQLNKANYQLRRARAETAQAQQEAEEAQRDLQRKRNCIINRRKRFIGKIKRFFKKVINAPCFIVHDIYTQKRKWDAARARQRDLEDRVDDFDKVLSELNAEWRALQRLVSAISAQKQELEHHLSSMRRQLQQESELSTSITLFYGHISSLFDHSSSLQNVIDKLISVELVIVPLEQISGKLSTLPGSHAVNEEISAALGRMRQNMPLLKSILTKYPLFFLNHVVS